MSGNGMLGGDLDAMLTLAERFVQAGANFNSNLSNIGKEADDARADLVAEMERLKGVAEELNNEMTSSLSSLSAQMNETNMTGGQADRMRTAFSENEQTITANQQNCQTFIGDASDIVNGALSNSLSTLNDNVTKAGAAANETAATFGTSVKNQVAAFKSALD